MNWDLTFGIIYTGLLIIIVYLLLAVLNSLEMIHTAMRNYFVKKYEENGKK